MSVRDDRIRHWVGELDRAMSGHSPWTVAAIATKVGEVDGPEAVVDARVQKAVLTEVKAMLDADPGFNQRFVATPEWKILHQLLTAARLRELTRVKIGKKGRSTGAGYAINELAATYYGRQVLDGLGFTRRRAVLTSDEFEKVRAEFAKIKLTLPEAVEPTFTETFFNTDSAEDPS